MPGDGKTLGYTVLYLMSTAAKDKQWAWKLLQYLGGKTKDGTISLIGLLPTVALVLLLQRYVVRGLTAGAWKG